MTATEKSVHVKASQSPMREQDDDNCPSNLGKQQSIPTWKIDPEKLTKLLKSNFGAGNYNVHVSMTQRAQYINVLVEN